MENVSLALHNSRLQSFPSGETASSFTIAIALSIYFPKLRAPLIFLALLVGVGRVLISGHYPSDVWASMMLGIFLGQLATKIVKPSFQKETA
jgi:undecaprenyl-diphosphatase